MGNTVPLMLTPDFYMKCFFPEVISAKGYRKYVNDSKVEAIRFAKSLQLIWFVKLSTSLRLTIQTFL